ncbi:MAG: 2-oxo acid dehydrogenase subunit E2, partial [Acidimicrobiia bacterium]|nr:2-oxo acid dehydrogenase subunit E2 [Acidimicrobiia bacterium]
MTTSELSDGGFGPNIWLVDEMYRRYLDAPDSVSEAWREFLADYTPGVGVEGTATVRSPGPVVKPALGDPPVSVAAVIPDAAVLLKGVSARIAERMDDSLTVPTATSVRVIPAKLLEVNRKIINNQLRRLTHGGKVSFTHLLGWAVVEAIKAQPNMNVAFRRIDDKPYMLRHDTISLGLAIDVARKDGSRSLMVPNIKGADAMTFQEFWLAYEEIVHRVRANQITPEDFAGTTVSLTNPGTIGT